MSRTIEENNISQTINLREVYGRTPTIEEKVEFADLARNEIIDRTQNGKNVDGRRFPQYTEDYAEFKGVSRNDVDLTLFGDMLNSIETEISGDNVIIKMAEDQTPKAHGNITGRYGQESPITGKKRDFFGLRQKDIDRLANQVKIVQETPGLLDILGTAPAPTQPQGINISQILTQIGLLSD